MKNNIALIGMMGAGKTLVGKEFALNVPNYKLVDIDAEIENREKMTISEIFKNNSEEYFRKIESSVIKEVCSFDNQVIALGGGAFEREENRKILKENSKIFYLKADAKTLFERIKNQTHRPLLQNGFDKKNIETILQRRIANYESADYIIDTAGKSVYDIVREILKGISKDA